MNLQQDLLITLSAVSEALEALGVRWAVGGSFASGVVRLSGELDLPYMRQVAAFGSLEELLERALKDADNGKR